MKKLAKYSLISLSLPLLLLLMVGCSEAKEVESSKDITQVEESKSPENLFNKDEFWVTFNIPNNYSEVQHTNEENYNEVVFSVDNEDSVFIIQKEYLGDEEISQQDIENMFKSDEALSNSQIVSIFSYEKDGINLTEVISDMSNGESTIRTIQVAFTHNQWFYVLTYGNFIEDFEDYIEDYNYLVASLKIKDTNIDYVTMSNIKNNILEVEEDMKKEIKRREEGTELTEEEKQSEKQSMVNRIAELKEQRKNITEEAKLKILDNEIKMLEMKLQL